MDKIFAVKSVCLSSWMGLTYGKVDVTFGHFGKNRQLACPTKTYYNPTPSSLERVSRLLSHLNPMVTSGRSKNGNAYLSVFAMGDYNEQ
jgi:hypothetical protein